MIRGTQQTKKKRKETKKEFSAGEPDRGIRNTNLDTETVPAMFARPVLALVREPIVRRGIDAFAPVRGEELVYVRNPHRTADNLAHAGHEQVAALGEQDGLVAPLLLLLLLLRLLRRSLLPLHVKRLERGGEAVQEHGCADDVRHPPLRRLGDVVADGVRDHRGVAVCVFDDVAVRVLGLVLDPVLVQPRDGVDVGEALERTRGSSEGGVELLDQRRGGFVLEEFVHRLADLIYA